MSKEKRGHGSNGEESGLEEKREREEALLVSRGKEIREEKWIFSFENCLRIELKSRWKKEKTTKEKIVDEKRRKEDGL